MVIETTGDKKNKYDIKVTGSRQTRDSQRELAAAVHFYYFFGVVVSGHTKMIVLLSESIIFILFFNFIVNSCAGKH